MGGIWERRTGWLVAAVLWGGMGCRTKVEPSAPSSAPAQRAVDLSEDRKALDSSWLLAIARAPELLSTLAETCPDGWRALFMGLPTEAVAAFEKAVKPEGAVEVRLGLARAALQLAEAHASLAELQLAVTPRWLDAWATRPGAETAADWRLWLSARHQGRVKTAPASIAVGAGSVVTPWATWLTTARETPEGKLLGGEPSEARFPAPATEAYPARLRAAAFARRGDWRSARQALRGVAPQAADLEIGIGDAVAVRDPGLAGFEAWIWAAVALDATGGLTGWPGLLAARAELILGRAEQAAGRLKALLAAPPGEAPALALTVLSGALNAEDLRSEAQGLLIEALVTTGGVAEARAIADQMSEQTVGRRVQRSRARAMIDGAVDVDAFPADRDVLTGALRDGIAALGAEAKGADDVSQLALVDRYVDEVQRRFAEGLGRGGRRALAVKARQTAEDKSAAMAPSARNTLPALAAAAADQLAIGQPRVALKYLGRLQDRLPPAVVPAEMLRDLLSLKAMEHDGSATAGQ